MPVRMNFRWGMRLIPFAEGTIARPFGLVYHRMKVLRSLSPFIGDDDPAAHNWIFTQAGHKATHKTMKHNGTRVVKV